MPVEDDEKDAEKGDAATHGQLSVERLVGVQKTGDEDRQHGGGCHQQADVGRHAELEGVILGEEVQRSSEQPRPGEQELLPDAAGTVPVRIGGQQGEVREDVAAEHDFFRAEAPQEDFGGDECGAPYRNDGDGDGVTAESGVHGGVSG